VSTNLGGKENREGNLNTKRLTRAISRVGERERRRASHCCAEKKKNKGIYTKKVGVGLRFLEGVQRGRGRSCNPATGGGIVKDALIKRLVVHVLALTSRGGMGYAEKTRE